MSGEKPIIVDRVLFSENPTLARVLMIAIGVGAALVPFVVIEWTIKAVAVIALVAY